MGLIALTVMVGCVRFGYDSVSKPDAGGGGSSGDSGMPQGDGSVGDAASSDGSVRPDTGTPDAADGDAASGPDSGGSNSDGGPSDGATTDPGDGGPSDGSTGLTDSGSTDSGSMDSGPIDSDGGGFDDPKRTEQCPDIPGAVFCDGFEKDDDFDVWTYPFPRNGEVTRSTTTVRSGSGSLRAYTHPNNNANDQTAARMSIEAVDHMTSGNLWARFYYYVPDWVEANPYFSTGVLSAIDTPYLGFSALITSSGMALGSLGDTTAADPDYVFPREQWMCVEMRVTIAEAPQGNWAFYVEGAPIVGESGRDTRPDQGYSVFEVGIHFTPYGHGEVEAYVDDVVVGTERIGCFTDLVPPS